MVILTDFESNDITETLLLCLHDVEPHVADRIQLSIDSLKAGKKRSPEEAEQYELDEEMRRDYDQGRM